MVNLMPPRARPGCRRNPSDAGTEQACRGGPVLGPAWPQPARALPPQPVARFPDVGDLVAEMMNPAIGIALEKAGDGGALAEHAEQLDLGVGQLDEHRGHAMLGEGSPIAGFLERNPNGGIHHLFYAG